MTNMSIQPLWLTHFIEILLVLEFHITKFIVGAISYKAHFRPQISSNGYFLYSELCRWGLGTSFYLLEGTWGGGSAPWSPISLYGDSILETYYKMVVV